MNTAIDKDTLIDTIVSDKTFDDGCCGGAR